MDRNDEKKFSSRDSYSKGCPQCGATGVSTTLPYSQGNIIVHQMRCPSCGCVYIWNERT